MKYFIALGFGTIALAACGGNVQTTGSGAAASTGTTGTATTGAGGAATTGVGGTATTGTATATTGTSGAGGGCPAMCAMSGFLCCGNTCVNNKNDILNCGTCGTKCMGANPFCDNGKCATPPCMGGPNCTGAQTCCGSQCCKAGELCCDVQAGASMLSCQQPVNGTCPKGCPMCVCASPETPIATPRGDRHIADLAVGDLVYSVDHDAIVAVPLLRINRAPVHDHHVVRVTLASGAVLEISTRHPTADGRTFGDLRAGDALDRIAVTAVERIPYAHPFTYDILPASETHAYFAGGALIGTTLTP
jgi:hypothetical protein